MSGLAIRALQTAVGLAQEYEWARQDQILMEKESGYQVLGYIPARGSGKYCSEEITEAVRRAIDFRVGELRGKLTALGVDVDKCEVQ